MAEGDYFLHPGWPVLWEDNHLLGLYKPAGLPVQGDETGGPSLLELAKGWLKERHGKPGRVFLGLVHRLDQPVAGVMLFCRTSKAAGRISEQFRTGRVRKRYLAVVEGTLTRRSERLVHHLERREKQSSRIVKARSDQSREARLTYRVVDVLDGSTLVEIDLETGRHHQIRLQMAHIGHPVLGDLRYGASAPVPGGKIALVATDLTVEHPVKREEVRLHCSLPRGWPWPPSDPKRDGPPWHWRELPLMSVLREGEPNR